MMIDFLLCMLYNLLIIGDDMKLNRRGFTLIELLVTIVIIGLVVGFSIYGIFSVINDSEEKATVLSEKNIKNAANLYSAEMGDSSWKKNSDFDAFCVTIGELMNKGFLDKNGVFENKSITKDTFVIVKRNNITFSIMSEDLVSNEIGNAENGICTGQSFTGESFNKPTIKNTTSYTDKIEISFDGGTADSGVKNYKCLYGESSSSVNKEGTVINNTCILNSLKSFTDYYVMIYMNTNGGSSILATGNRNYKTSDFKNTIFNQNKNKVTIKYEEKDTNGNNINNPSYYFYSTIESTSNVNLEACSFKNDVYTCSGNTKNVKSNTWYKTSNINVELTYPEINNEIDITTRIYDGSNNYKENKNTIKINRYEIIFYKNKASLIDGSSETSVTKYCMAAGNDSCTITSPSITPPIGHYTVGWNTSGAATTSNWNVNASKNIKENSEYYAVVNPYKIYITYGVNGGAIKSSTTDEEGTVYNWSIIDDLIYKNNRLLKSSNNYGGNIYVNGLPNYNNSRYISVTKEGYHVEKNKEWKCTNGCSVEEKVFDQYTSYSTSEFCDASNGDCSVTVSINWKANTYTVKYDANGGTGTTASSSHTYDVSKELTENGFSRTGYTFAGWSTTKGGSVTYNNNASVKNLTITNNGSVTLYAVWTANTYTVKYDANGGTGSTANSSHTYDTPKELTANGFSKTGYTFAGWSTTKGDTVKYTNKESVKNLTATNNGTVTLYAVWTANTYTVEYDANGGTGTTVSSTHTYNVSKELTANEFSRTGYKFKGWSTTKGGTVEYQDKESVKNLTTSNNGSVTLYAVWEPNRVTIKYNLNGGSFGTSTGGYNWTNDSSGIISKNGTVLTHTINYGGTLGSSGLYNYNNEPVLNIVKKGHSATEHAEWKCLSGCSNSGATYDHLVVYSDSDFCDLSKGDCTVILGVNWEINKYTVTTQIRYRYQNSEYKTDDFTKKEEIEYGKSYTPSNYDSEAPTGYHAENRYRYYISGEFIAEHQTGKDSFIVEHDTLVYVYYKPNEYTIKYDANGGTGAPNSQTKYYGVNLTLSNERPKRSGYEFIGWSTSSTATSSTYDSGSSYSSNKAVTLYAVWKANPLTFGNQTFTLTYSNEKQTKTFTGASDGTNSYNYSITGTGSSYFSISGNTLSVKGGTSAGTYTLTVTAEDSNSGSSKSAAFTVKINQITLTPSVTAFDKTYNGNTNATCKVTLSGAVSGENPTATATGTFEDANVGSDKTVTCSSITLGNDWTTNYKLSTKTKPTNASITAKSISVSWGSTTSWTYDGSSHKPTASISTGISGESMILTVSGAKTNVGSYTATASCNSVTGGNAKCSNYKLTNTTNEFSIKKASCTCTISSVPTGLKYPGSTSGTIKYSCGGDGTIGVASSNTSVISVVTISSASTSLTAKAAGSSTITVSRAAGTNYNACTPDSESISVARGTYTITYNANGGSGTFERQNATIGNSITLTKNIPVYGDGSRHFLEWNTKADGKGTSYKSGASYTGSSDVTLYAKWEEHQWKASGNSLHGAGSEPYTCGYIHKEAYIRYCNTCGMSYFYYGEKYGGNEGRMWCPCIHEFTKTFIDEELTFNYISTSPVLNGGLPTLSVATTSPKKICDEHKPNGKFICSWNKEGTGTNAIYTYDLQIKNDNYYYCGTIANHSMCTTNDSRPKALMYYWEGIDTGYSYDNVLKEDLELNKTYTVHIKDLDGQIGTYSVKLTKELCG